LLSPVLPLRSRRRQSQPVVAAPRYSVHHLRHRRHRAVARWPRPAAPLARRGCLYPSTLRSTRAATGWPLAARGRLRHGAGAANPADRGCRQNAGLPCRRVVAARPQESMDLSIVILNYNTREHLRACLQVLQVEGSTSLSGGPIEAEVIVV